MLSYHSDQMSQRPNVSMVALWWCSLNVFGFVFVFLFLVRSCFLITLSKCHNSQKLLLKVFSKYICHCHCHWLLSLSLYFLLDRPCFPITLTAKNRRQNIWCYMPPRQRLSCRVPFLAWNETGVKKEIWEVSSFQAGCCSVRPPPPPPTNQMKPLSSHAAPPNTPLSSLQVRCFKSLSQPLLLIAARWLRAMLLEIICNNPALEDKKSILEGRGLQFKIKLQIYIRHIWTNFCFVFFCFVFAVVVLVIVVHPTSLDTPNSPFGLLTPMKARPSWNPKVESGSEAEAPE